MNINVFNLISSVNETNFSVQHESRECKCRQNENVSNPKKKWNHGKFRCECKQLDGQSSSKDYYMWSPSTYDCQCDEAMQIQQFKADRYLYVKNFLYEKRLFSKLVVACKNQIFNATETSVVEKKLKFEQSNCLIYTMLLLNYVPIIISCHICQLLLLLHKTLDKKGILIIMLI